ncbi:hypothetical protein GCM10010448_38020 [Streptomyces glomeratus]|uniref:Tetratricopeptide repeat protein n=1 Tax=Streptomyces glomeratus TaxID=284452 RepID=A0ABP6LSJ4_9ACTN
MVAPGRARLPGHSRTGLAASPHLRAPPASGPPGLASGASGPHPNTLTLRSNPAGAYESAGDLGRAIPLYEQTPADRVRVL